MDPSNGHTDSSPSGSSPSSSPLGWWYDPTRLIAVAGVVALRYFDKLDQVETTIVLSTALGGQITTAAWRAVQRLRGK